MDAIKNGKCKVEDLAADDLPAEYRALDLPGRKAKVEAAAKARGDIQKRILTLNAERERFRLPDEQSHRRDS